MRVPADLSHLQIPKLGNDSPAQDHAYSAWVVGAASTLSASHRSIHSSNSMVGGRGNARDELGSIAAYTRERVTVHLDVLLGRDGLDVGRTAKRAALLELTGSPPPDTERFPRA